MTAESLFDNLPQQDQQEPQQEAKHFPQFNEDGTPLLDEEGNHVWGAEKSPYVGGKKKKGRTPKAPKVKTPKLYEQFNDDGTSALDEEGNAVMGEVHRIPVFDVEGAFVEFLYPDEKKAKRAAPTPRVDENGNPIPRTPRPTLSLDQKIYFTEKGKATKYRAGSDRAKHFESITEGMTVGKYYDINGGKAASHRYLIHQLAVMGTITVTSPE